LRRRRLAAILAADVAGHNGLIRADNEGTIARREVRIGNATVAVEVLA
jgi:hypothetical protein